MPTPSRSTILITGASRHAGIGTGIAREFAREFAHGCACNHPSIFITYYRPYDHVTGLAGSADEPSRLLAELREHGCRAEGMELDLSDPNAPRQLFETVEAALGTVNVLVNNATYSMPGGIDTLTAEQLDETYAVNLRGMALLCVEFVRRYKLAIPNVAPGRIINLSSGQSVGAMPGELAYVATKGAIEAFTVSLSAEVAALGITVNAVDPGITDTGWIPPDLKAKWQTESPKGRVGTPTDAARLIRFLASPEAEWITGQVIHSRGGM